MKRIPMVPAAVACLGAAVLGAAATRGEHGPAPRAEPPAFRAVVHVNFADGEQQRHGLRNVANMLKGAGAGPEIEVVCHANGIGLLVRDRTQCAAEVASLIGDGVRFVACENTMRERSIAREALLPGVATVPSGAVEIVRKQQEGHGYFKP
jgi:intracellular sulfur oxidation DsrE/DsrF family protein